MRQCIKKHFLHTIISYCVLLIFANESKLAHKRCDYKLKPVRIADVKTMICQLDTDWPCDHDKINCFHSHLKVFSKIFLVLIIFTT